MSGIHPGTVESELLRGLVLSIYSYFPKASQLTVLCTEVVKYCSGDWGERGD